MHHICQFIRGNPKQDNIFVLMTINLLHISIISARVCSWWWGGFDSYLEVPFNNREEVICSEYSEELFSPSTSLISQDLDINQIFNRKDLTFHAHVIPKSRLLLWSTMKVSSILGYGRKMDVSPITITIAQLIYFLWQDSSIHRYLMCITTTFTRNEWLEVREKMRTLNSQN